MDESIRFLHTESDYEGSYNITNTSLTLDALPTLTICIPLHIIDTRVCVCVCVCVGSVDDKDYVPPSAV